MLNPAIFREYDIRGVADVELLDLDVEVLKRGDVAEILGGAIELYGHAFLRILSPSAAASWVQA